MPRFGKDKDQTRKEELDRQAAEEVERLTRRGGPPGMGGGMGGFGGPGAPPMGMPSPLERMAAEMADRPRPVLQRNEPKRAAPKPQQQAFTPLPSGGVGSSFGPGGLNPGPRMGGAAPPPPAFAGADYDDNVGGPVSGPPVFNAEPDEDEEMTITEMALMDYAARTGHDPEDLVIRYDASTAEEMRDAAMRQFYERQQARRAGPATNNPFAPAGMRSGPSGPAPLRRTEDPKAVGGALAQRLANRRRREEEEARRARAAAEPALREDDDGAVASVLARRRRALGIDQEPGAAAEPEVEQVDDTEEFDEVDDVPEVGAPRPRLGRGEASPGPRAVLLEPVVDERAPSLEEMATSTATRRTSRTPKKASAPAAKAPATKKTTKAAKAGKVTPAAKAAPAAKKTPKPAEPAAKAAKTTKAAKGKKAGATLSKPPAARSPAAKKSARANVFCVECGEKNPAIAKFCFNCGSRLVAPEN